MQWSVVDPSVCLSVCVCPIVRQPLQSAAGLLLSAPVAGHNRSTAAGACAQQQPRRSTALSGGQL